MIRWLTKFVITLLVLLVLTIIAVYAGMQTRWGSSQLSSILTKFTDYDVSVGILGHQFSTAGEFVLQDVELKAKKSTFSLNAKQLIIEVNWRNLFSDQLVKRIVVTQGNLIAVASEQILPLNASVLQFTDSQISYKTNSHNLQATGFTGGITPWKSVDNNWFGEGDFRFTANGLNFDNHSFQRVSVTGKSQPAFIELSNISAGINGGLLSGAGKQSQDGALTIDNLTLSGIGWQTEISFDNLFTQLDNLPPITLNNIELINTSIQGKDWAVTGLNSKIEKLGFVRGSWNTPKSQVELDADQLVIKNHQISQLIANLNIDQDVLQIDKLSGYYEKGVFNLEGSWQRNDHILTIDKATLAGILYALPEDWLSFINSPTPDWLSGLSVKQFSLTQSILMNINADFPFEFTKLSGSITNVDFIKQKQWGFWGGKAVFNADASTLNQVMLRRPYIEIRQNAQTSLVATATASIDRGISKLAILAKQDAATMPFLLKASGTNVDLSILNQWGWNNLPREILGDFEVTLKGDLLGQSVQKSLDGELTAIPLRGTTMFKTVNKGVVTSSVENIDKPLESTRSDENSNEVKDNQQTEAQ
nr:AsmA family protein [uncultured Moellerella sp.]